MRQFPLSCTAPSGAAPLVRAAASFGPAGMVLLVSAGTAAAHPGHLADVAGAGHGHWVAGAAIGIAIVLGLWGALKGGKARPDAAEAGPDEDADAEEARA